ncbi:TetR/AcrR family transcriptional regulator [Agromyces mediolanus]|uniref:TetR/AcrR family transcriptional regulator n=1 Tax=Agromyces mediolanus TaxID=41986 RepID=UPI00203D4774|nr:TetR/AcrR family transcriptional regulator [Agromyces mediolanus]MCM3658138.1 TetR/AcrR family transcriptional regulator [Agromyces mediolanus]
MARPRNQAQRRSELVTVTSRLLIERGASAARLTDIAEAAKLTPASVSYYYPELPALYAETYATAALEYIARRRERVAQIPGAAARLAECLRLGIPIAGEPSFDATVLLIELGAQCVRDQGFEAPATEFERAQLELFEEIVRDGVDGGDFRTELAPARVARLLLAAEDGLAGPVITGRLTSEEALATILDLGGALLGTTLPVPADVAR